MAPALPPPPARAKAPRRRRPRWPRCTDRGVVAGGHEHRHCHRSNADPARHLHVGGTTAGYRKYWYDTNGNATRRINGSQDVTLTYDAENRLTGMTGGVTASYVYDGDGTRVKETIAGVTRVFVGNTYEIDNGTVKKYYYAGAMRVAENSGGALYYLLTDHLGSTALTLDSSGTRQTELRYYPFGAARYNANNQVTTYRFTGQRWDSGTALYFYQSRWYDPVIGRFLAADTIVPQPENPQSLNRYSYVGNRPLRFVDPSGFDPIDAAWEQAFYAAHGRAPTDQDRRDRFFSILFAGSGANGSWTDEDWAWYHARRESLWEGSTSWQGAPAAGLDRFVTHLQQLASYYAPGEEGLYAQAIGFIWGGVPLGHAIPAAWQMATNPGAAWAQYEPLFEGTANWRASLVDDPNPSHHYAGLFYLGYFFGPAAGYASNWLRDGPLSELSNPDLNLGYVAVSHGSMLYDGIISMAEVGLAVTYAVDARSGLWASNSPGHRVPWYYFQPWAR